MPTNLPDELTGAFIEVAEVTNLGATDESETIVGNTTADVEISKDQDTASANKHSQRRSVRKRTYNRIDITFPALLVPGVAQLETLNIVDTNGEEVYGTPWEAARIHIYDQEGDSSPTQSFEFEDVEPDWDSINLPEDMGEISFSLMVHDVWRRGTT